jgi:hypothetical protein
LSNSGGGNDEIVAFLDDPPEWLAELLDRCRREPGRYLNSTASSIATAVYGSPRQWREVKPILEDYLS